MTKRHYRSGHPHILVRIKNELELSQAEIQDWLGISLDVFKNIVSGRKNDWREYAEKVSRATGVSVKSLLDNSTTPLVTGTRRRWTAQGYRDSIIERRYGAIENERSAGRRALQRYRILIIKIARVLLASYRDRKSTAAFFELLRVIETTGKEFPSYTLTIPYKPAPGAPILRELRPDKHPAVLMKELCPSSQFDSDLQGAVSAVPSIDPAGITTIFDRFMKEILAEERRQDGSEKLPGPIRNDWNAISQTAKKWNAAPVSRRQQQAKKQKPRSR